ncbi:MAG: hypothetical protein ACRDL8_23630, partial [Solirubrobacteraceae bacterium]
MLDEDPDLGDAIEPALRPRALEDCVAPVTRLPRGGWTPAAGDAAIRAGIGLMVLDGLLLRRVGVDGRFGAELLGDGDLIRPWPG